MDDELLMVLILKSTYDMLASVAKKKGKTVSYVISEALSKYLSVELKEK